MIKLYFTTLLLWLCSFAHAEGSRELNSVPNSPDSNNAYRTFLSYTTPVTGSATGWYPITAQDSVESRSYFYVYAIVGDSICVASSALGVVSGAIRVYAPDGTLFATYTTAPSDTGLIRSGTGSKSREAAGPFGYYNGGVGGYIPRVIVAGQAGIWRVEFISPTPTTSNSNYFSTPTLVPLTKADFLQPTTSCIISAFDVSIVKNRAVITGRVYTDYMSLSGGDLRRTTGGRQYFFTEYYTMYIMTKQGYRYDLTMKGLAPYGYFLYADNVGLQLADGITPAYESISYQPTRPANRRILRPGDPDTYSESKHKMFFNVPDATMPTTALLNNQTVWLNPALATSSGLIVLQYIYTGTPNPLSGYFLFNYPNDGFRYSIIIDCNGDFIYGNANDVTLSGTTVAGNNTLTWDGRDANGVIMPFSSCINARIEIRAGEIHTPLADAENFRGGIELKRVNGNGTLPNYTIHWNDSVLNDNNNISPTYMKKTPPAGVSSLGGIHSWERQEAATPPTQGYTGNPTHTNYYGDTRYMDIWAFDTLQTGNFSAIICYTLPLQFIHFSGMRYEGRNQLDWQVSGEWQGVQFTIQRREGNSFVPISKLNASAASFYSFADKNAGNNAQLYRIKMQQRDGKITYSKELLLDGGAVNSTAVYPNPASKYIIIKAMDNIRSVSIINIAGSVVYQQQIKAAATTRISLPLLPAGQYRVQVHYDNQAASNHPLVIQ